MLSFRLMKRTSASRHCRRTWSAWLLFCAFACYICYTPIHLAVEAHDALAHGPQTSVSHSHDHENDGHHSHQHENDRDSEHERHAAIDHDLTLLKCGTSSDVSHLFVGSSFVLPLERPSDFHFTLSVPFESPPSIGPPEPRQPRGPPLI